MAAPCGSSADVSGDFQVVRRKKGKRTQQKHDRLVGTPLHTSDDSHINVENLKLRIVKCRDELTTSEFYVGVLKSLERAIHGIVTSSSLTDSSQIPSPPTASDVSHSNYSHLHTATEMKRRSQERWQKKKSKHKNLSFSPTHHTNPAESTSSRQMSYDNTPHSPAHTSTSENASSSGVCGDTCENEVVNSRKIPHSPAHTNTTENSKNGGACKDGSEDDGNPDAGTWNERMMPLISGMTKLDVGLNCKIRSENAVGSNEMIVTSQTETEGDSLIESEGATPPITDTFSSQTKVEKKKGPQDDSSASSDKATGRSAVTEVRGQDWIESDGLPSLVKVTERSQGLSASRDEAGRESAVPLVKDTGRSQTELEAEEGVNKGECTVLHCGTGEGHREGEVSWRGAEESLSMLVYGLGNFASCPIARHQLALVLALRQHWKVAAANCEVYDPKFSETEKQILVELGCSVIQRNEEGKRCVTGPTLALMPHCAKALFNNLLWANWSPRQLQQLVVMGNSFSNMLDGIPQRLWNGHIKYVAMISAHTSEEPVVTTAAYNTIFNDLSIHWFPPSSLLQLSPDTWSEVTEPEYDPNDLEIILAPG